MNSPAPPPPGEGGAEIPASADRKEHSDASLPQYRGSVWATPMLTLPAPLAPLGRHSQFIVYKTVPSTRKPGKTDKLPVDWRTGQMPEKGSGGAHDPAIWLDFDTAAAQALRWGMHVGFVLTKNDPFWFVDVDGALLPDGTWNAIAQQFAQVLAGAAVEVSGSGKGLHFIGSGPVPEHGTKNSALGIECYDSLRFIALTGLNATGSADWRSDERIAWIVQTYFPPVAPGAERGDELSDAPRSDWKGPELDHELIRRASMARSAGAVFGDRATFADLWLSDRDKLAKAFPSSSGDEYDRSSADAALAAHLAFWTGCHGTRIERLMRASALQREKWDSHASYLALTIRNACARRVTVCQDKSATPEAVVVADPLDLSEDAFADLFVERHGDKLRFTFGIGWMRNEDSHFVRDDNKGHFDLARKTIRSAAPGVARLRSAKTVAAVITLSQADPRIVVSPQAWDADPLALNTPAGVVDLRTGTMRPRARDLHTQVAGFSPDFEASCPTFMAFLRTVFLGDSNMVEFVQRLLGYFATGDRREQFLFFAHGSGANGKSTLFDLFLRLLGSYALKLSTGVLMQAGVERHPTEIAQLRSKRLALSSEIEAGQWWAESRVKELTGDETTSARFMRQDFFEFRLTHKHLIVGNNKPRLRGGDAALARRFVLIPFLATFPESTRDKHMGEKLRAEAPAILAWVIEGAVKWHASGLQVPDSVVAASAAYMAENDDLAAWVDECCVTGPAMSCKASDLYRSFSQWAIGRGQHPPSQTTWGNQLSAMPGISKRRSNGILYAGISLRPHPAFARVNE